MVKVKQSFVTAIREVQVALLLGVQAVESEKGPILTETLISNNPMEPAQ